MKVLVLNSGSSSIKFRLFDLDRDQVLANGHYEKIGENDSTLHYNDRSQVNNVSNHQGALEFIVEKLTSSEDGVIQSPDELTAIGHRVVHGGESFKHSVLIDSEVLKAIEEMIPLAPLHNPANLQGIQMSLKVFPQAQQVAVFDTAFHQSMPESSYRYAVPSDLYAEYSVRKYGFHGSSHKYVAQRAAKYLNRKLDELNLITIHLGNGCSITAIKNGRSYDTSMGLTPLEGLMMGTRCGDIDPAIPQYLHQRADLSYGEIDRLLNKSSGLKGISGNNDVRQVIEAAESGAAPAKLALEMYIHRLKKYIGGYMAILDRVDAIIFTAGVGENSSFIREKALNEMSHLGVQVDLEKNEEKSREERSIHSPDSQTDILVIPTNEELLIARETKETIQKSH